MAELETAEPQTSEGKANETRRRSEELSPMVQLEEEPLPLPLPPLPPLETSRATMSAARLALASLAASLTHLAVQCSALALQ